MPGALKTDLLDVALYVGGRGRVELWLLLLSTNDRKASIVNERSCSVTHVFWVRNLGRAGMGGSPSGFPTALQSNVSWAAVI